MLTLSQATKLTKKALKWGIILIVAILIITTLLRTAATLRQRFAPPPAPQIGFGKLPSIKFPTKETPANIKYTVDTLTGVLPALPTQQDIIKISSPKPDLLALSKAEEKAAKIGFSDTPKVLSNTLYKWTFKKDSLSKELTMDIFSSNFSLTSNFLNNADVASAKNLPTEEGAIGISQDFLNSISSFPDDIDKNKTKTKLFSITNAVLTPTTSLSKTQVIEISFFQKDINGTPVFYPDENSSLIKVYVASGATDPQIVKATFTHQNASSITSTYPLKTSEEAFSELKNGKAYVLSNVAAGEVKIKNISLGYYMESETQTYLLPIIVLEGDNFTAYVSAVKDDFVNK